MIRLLIFMLFTVALSGCKFLVMVPRGGEVQSIASGTCPALTNCVHDIPDATYTETFTAVPDAGWEFVKWNNGGSFQCADSTNPICAIDSTLLAGTQAEGLIADWEDIYIMPVFREINIDTVVVDGKEWAQLDQFVNLSWNDIDAVCPQANGGACNGVLNGVLNAYDMTGWTWANVTDLVSVMENHYGATPTAPEYYSPGGPGVLWAEQFLTDFRATEVGAVGQWNYREVSGWLAEETQLGAGKWWTVHDETSAGGFDDFAMSGENAKQYTTFGRGAFFYRALP